MSLAEMTADLRLIAKLKEIELTEAQVDKALRLHLRGRSYLDAIKQAVGQQSHAEESARVSRRESFNRSAAVGAETRRKT
jgi:hypothetical protein